MDLWLRHEVFLGIIPSFSEIGAGLNPYICKSLVKRLRTVDSIVRYNL